MRPHPREEHPDVGEFLPRIAGHFFDERPLPVDDLVVAEHQDEMLVKRIDHREGHHALVVTAIDWVLADVAQTVVHPAHVPFEPKAQTARVGRLWKLPGHEVDSSAMVAMPGKRS